jgi:hypothetical protein
MDDRDVIPSSRDHTSRLCGSGPLPMMFFDRVGQGGSPHNSSSARYPLSGRGAPRASTSMATNRANPNRRVRPMPPSRYDNRLHRGQVR